MLFNKLNELGFIRPPFTETMLEVIQDIILFKMSGQV